MTPAPLPDSFATTRASLRALACYVISPSRKARTGRIGLHPFGGGFGTPPFDDGTRLVVHGAELAFAPGVQMPITTLRAAAAFAGVSLSPDPGVGHDLPPFEPDLVLPVDRSSSLALGAWYALGHHVLEGLRPMLAGATVSEAQLWPEHFDYAVTVALPDGVHANVGFSPGDAFESDPYVYVGPHVTDGLTGDEWNAPFGAFLPYAGLASAEAPGAQVLAFIADRLGRLS